MQAYKVDFDSIEWQSTLPGARFKGYRSGEKRIRLVEFTAEFVEPHWCERGHIGFVLDGVLAVDFHGEVITYRKGDGLFIPSGASSGHKARSLTPVVRLILVESD